MYAFGKPGTGLQAVACANSIVPNRLRICLVHTLHSHFTTVSVNSAGSCIILIMESNCSIRKASTDCGCHLLNVGSCYVGAVQAQLAPCLCHSQPVLALNLHVINQNSLVKLLFQGMLLGLARVTECTP